MNFHRAHARRPCNIEVQLFLGRSTGGPIGRGLLIDISISGAFLRCAQDLEIGSFHRLRVAGQSAAAEFIFRVARAGSRGNRRKDEMRHYGLTFEWSPAAERRLRLLIDRLPRENTLAQDLRDRATRGYWSS